MYILETYKRFNISFKRGKGIYLYDDKNKKYIDAISGLGVNGLGHCHKKIVETLNIQSKKIWHTSNLFNIDIQERLAENLIKKTIAGKVFFCNSGAESVEAGLKFAKKILYVKKQKPVIASALNSFHGRTIGALSLTGQKKYQEKFYPLMPNVLYFEYNNIKSLRNIFKYNVKAIIIELIQGEGGVINIDKNFLKVLINLCKKNNCLLIVDEVQTGIGKTGELFAFQYYKIKPDIICISKALGNGFPIGATIVSKKYCNLIEPGDHASTFGGNFIASSVANTVLNVIYEENLLDNVKKNSILLDKYLDELIKEFSFVKNKRGIGYMRGLELDKDINLSKIIPAGFSQGIILNLCGEGNVLRALLPLICSKKHIELIISKIRNVFKKI